MSPFVPASTPAIDFPDFPDRNFLLCAGEAPGENDSVFARTRRVSTMKSTKLFCLLTLFASLGAAAESPDVMSRLAAVEGAAKSAQSAGDNGWMLVCSALVLMMTGPGLALFYGGLVRRKNVLATMMHSFILMAVVTVIWAIYGYSLAFGGNGPVLGDFSFAFLQNVGSAPNTDYAGTIPHQTFMVYQLMFAIITPALISGAFAERIKFSAMLLFTVLWATLVYFPMAHMVWGKGGLLNAALGGKVPCYDFAGGTVVHITSGVSALVCALWLGKRIGYPHEPIKPHNLVLSVIGACLLWVGWFGFNAGSALAASGLATSAFVATHFGAAAAALGWVAAEWIHAGKPSVLGGISGAVAGLVAITPASGFVQPFPALLIGLCAGLGCYLMVVKVKSVFGYDDALDAFGVHGAGGTLGAILTGVFATSAVNEAFKDSAGHVMKLGAVDGNAGQILNQAIGVAIAWVLAIVGTLIILKICDVTIGVRATREQEVEGLDVTLHGEEGYILEA
jgi:ammonium transporter, Amt family